MQKMILVLSMFVMMFAGGVVARADEGEGSHSGEWRQRMEGQMQKLFNDLNLSDEQKKLLEENRKSHREQMGMLRKNMREWRLQMHEELQKPELDMAKINDLQGKLKEAQGKTLDYRLDGILAVHKILTPEQYKEFSKQMKQRKENFRKRMDGKFGKSDDSLQNPAEVPSGKSQ